MIKQHFSLNSHPFQDDLPIEHLQVDARFQKALDRLTLALQLGGIAALTARTGCGKTSLLRLLLHQLERARDHRCVYVHLSSLRGAGLFRAILAALGCRPRLGRDRMFDQVYDHVREKGLPLVLMLDEGHLLDSTSLTDLRMLTGNIDEGPGIRILLAGQDQMRRTLQAETLTDLRERIALNAALRPLDEAETCAYIDHRLHLAGASEAFLDISAKRKVHIYSDGIPRRINNLITLAMVEAMQCGKHEIDEDLLHRAGQEASR